VSAQPTATPVEIGEDDEIVQELKKLQQQLREQLTLNAASNKRLAQLAVPKMDEQNEAKKKAEEVAALEQVLLSKITTVRSSCCSTCASGGAMCTDAYCCSDEVRRDRDARPTPPQQQRRVPRRRTPAHPRSPTTTPLRSSRGELGQANL
jgi:hypothetical protein